MIRLEKQKHNKPEFEKLARMLRNLEAFLNEDANPGDRCWSENFNAIIDFQDNDGSFRLFDTYEIPSDARVDFCYLPTYICSAILMKACLTDPDAFTLREMTALERGLEMTCARNLRGHGYEGLKGQIEAVNIFMKAGVREFLDLHPNICPKFSEMMGKIIERFHEMEAQNDFSGPWGESYEDEVKKINGYFSHRKVFVYGTLMRGEANSRYLENATLLGPAAIEGYDMYNVGWYPAIIPGDGIVVGETYLVPESDMAPIDALEGEGSLYAKQCETLTINGNADFAFVYVYLGDCSGLERIAAWKMQYVWYVSYGSNMLYDRFMCYIEGGSYDESRYREACKDPTPPLAVRTVKIPFDMYFGNTSGSWNLGGVSFLDTSKKGKSLGVAYLITQEQLEHVAREENGGRQPGGGEWYEDIIGLGEIGGIEVKTITNTTLRKCNQPSQAYLDTLFKGIRENWPEMSDEDIENYLKSCIR